MSTTPHAHEKPQPDRSGSISTYNSEKESLETPTPPNGPLAPAPLAINSESTAGSALAEWVLQTLRIRPKSRDHINELDAVST